MNEHNEICFCNNCKEKSASKTINDDVKYANNTGRCPQKISQNERCNVLLTDNNNCRCCGWDDGFDKLTLNLKMTITTYRIYGFKDGKKVFVFSTPRRVSSELADLTGQGLFIYDIQKIKNFICWNKEMDGPVSAAP